MMKYFVDLETTVNGGPKGDSPEAHWLNNRVILCGYCNTYNNVHVSSDVDTLCNDILDRITHGEDVRIIAHNAKFDLKYLIRERPDVEWSKVHVWDTMTWEYLNSGHQRKLISLTDAVDLYNIHYGKQLNLGALLASGVKMEDIPTDELTDYLIDDVIYLRQLYVAQLTANTTVYEPNMDYLLPLCEMELNGLPVDRALCTTKAMALQTSTQAIFNDFRGHMKSACEWQDGSPLTDDDFSELCGTKSKTIKPMSNRTLSFLLFGQPEELKVTPKWHVKFKAGVQPRYTATDTINYFGINAVAGKQGFPVSESELTKMQQKLGKSTLIEQSLEYRAANKILGTYLMPFLAVSAAQGSVYPKLNTAVTSTGRLSSSKPNGQNMPPVARECVRVDDEHELQEIDFQQLEMVAAATLSNDLTMISDICKGEDLHYNTGKSVFGWSSPSDMNDKDRKIVKGVNFGLLYGGKANGLSKSTGVDRAVVQKLINSFYARYPRVAAWQSEVFNTVVDNMKPFDFKNGEQRYAASYEIPQSTRRFLFIEHQSPDFVRKKTGRAFSFSPQHTANYPVQGFAGGEIVMFALTWLWTVCQETEAFKDVKFHMTVHDSILVVTPKGLDLTKLVEQMCADTAAHYNLPVPLHCDIDRGNYWQ